jgi:hypothetical protein
VRSRPRLTPWIRLYPKIVRATASILAHGKVVAPVDVLVRMRVLDPRHLEDWRRGRVPYLERVIQGNLTRLSRLLRILRFHAHDLNLVPSWTAYVRWGKGPKQRLRFTKTGEPSRATAASPTTRPERMRSLAPARACRARSLCPWRCRSTSRCATRS